MRQDEFLFHPLRLLQCLPWSRHSEQLLTDSESHSDTMKTTNLLNKMPSICKILVYKYFLFINMQAIHPVLVNSSEINFNYLAA